MARPKRNRAQRERDLTFVADLYCQGLTHEKICSELNSQRDYKLSRSQITRDVQALLARWRESSLKSVNDLKVRELAKLDNLEGQYWAAWQKSCEDFVSFEENQVNDQVAYKQGGMRPTYNRIKNRTRNETMIGDSRYLDGVGKCIDTRCKILGLYSSNTVSVNWRKQAEEVGINPDEVIDLVRNS